MYHFRSSRIYGLGYIFYGNYVDAHFYELPNHSLLLPLKNVPANALSDTVFSSINYLPMSKDLSQVDLSILVMLVINREKILENRLGDIF